MLAVIDTWLEMNGSEDGIISNFFIEGLIGIIGPFALWIGGALLLGRIGAKGPQIMQLLLGRTPLLNDVKRGLKGSGSAESVNRLAVIMLLTLSIVTLAAVQGYTGTLVDEKTTDATVGSDLQITLEQSYDEAQLLSLVSIFTDAEVTATATTVPSLFLSDSNGGDELLTWVVLDENEDILRWSEQSIPGTNIDATMAAYRNGGFTAGEDAAYSLDIAGSGRGDENRLDDVLLKPTDSQSEEIAFVWEKLSFNFSSGGATETDPTALFMAYSSLMEGDWSGLDLSEQDLSGRNFGPVDLTGTDFSNANLAGANLSQALFYDTNLEGADLSGANLRNAVFVNVMGGSLEGANLIGADLTGAFGNGVLSTANLGNATCPDGTSARRNQLCYRVFSNATTAGSPTVLGRYHCSDHQHTVSIHPVLHGCSRVYSRSQFSNHEFVIDYR